MKNFHLIAHRGLVNGPDNALENNPVDEDTEYDHLRYEFDIWFADNKWYLGHDKPEVEIEESFITNHRVDTIYHAKTLITLQRLQQLHMHCFYHRDDNYTLTSKGIIWAHPLVLDDLLMYKGSLSNVVLVLKDKVSKASFFKLLALNIYGICTPHVNYYNTLLPDKW